MRFNSFKYLDKVLHIIDVGLIDALNNTPDSKNKKTTSTTKIVLKRVNDKLNQILWFPLGLLFKSNDKQDDELLKRNWLIYESRNNFNTLSPLKKDQNIFVKPNKTIIFRYLIFYKIIYVIPLIVWLLKRNKLRRFFLYYEVLGIVEESRRLIKKYQPNKVIFANDINPYQIALKIAAMNQKVKTYYFQHASISGYMPPLDFDVSFLEGQDSYDKYKKIGEIKGEVELIGMIKYQSKNYLMNENNDVRKIGIALNLIDNLYDVRDVVEKITKMFPELEICIRQHPRDYRILPFNNEKIRLSSSKTEDVFKFLEKVDLLIAGDSSIHLEAALLNVVSIYYKFTASDFFDVYKFVENDLVDFAKNIDILLAFIGKQKDKKTNVIDRTKYYNEYQKSKIDFRVVLEKYDL